MAYNLTNISNSSTPLALMQNVNTDIMSGMLGVMFLLMLTVIVFLGFYFSTRDLRQTVMGTSWISFILAVFLRAMSLVPSLAVFVTLVMAAGAIGFFWASDR